MTTPPPLPPRREPPTLRGELRAVFTLYLVISVLPLLIGWLMGPGSR